MTAAVETEEPVLAMQNVAKNFGGVRALKGIELDVRRGEVHGLVGENGSGKSTLVKILAGFHSPETGATATIEGREFQLGSAAATHVAGIRFVHQELGLVDTLSVVDNMGLSRGFQKRWGRIYWRGERKRAAAAIARLGYSLDVKTFVADLPIAHRTVVAIARAIDVDEHAIHLLVLDEPTASLSAGEAERLFDVVRAVREQGISVIFVSHHLEEVLALADRITVLRDGERVGTFARKEVDRRRLIELITGGAIGEGTEASAGGPAASREVLSVAGLTGPTLSSLDLTLREGEIVGVTGLTGSGRDELPFVLFGVVPWRAGTVSIGGEEVKSLSPEKAIEFGFGLVSGDRHRYALLPTFSVLENVTITDLGACSSHGLLSRRRERAEAHRWIEILSIRPPEPTKNIMALSGGNQQKVAFAKVLRTNPRLLLLDDPTSGVDVGAKADIHRLIEEIASHGTAVLLASSDNEELVRVCNRVIVLRRGSVVRELARGELDADLLTQLAL